MGITLVWHGAGGATSNASFKVLSEGGWQNIRKKPIAVRMTLSGRLDRCVGHASSNGYPVEWNYNILGDENDLATLRTFYLKRPPYDIFDFTDLDGITYSLGIYFTSLGIPVNRGNKVISGAKFNIPVVFKRKT